VDQFEETNSYDIGSFRNIISQSIEDKESILFPDGSLWQNFPLVFL